MSGSLAEILERSRAARPPGAPTHDGPEDAEDEYPCYAKLRGARQAAFMLELRSASGDGEAFDYGLLGRVQFDPTAGLVLRFANGVVTIRGKNLRPLYDGIVAHRVCWVREVEGGAGDPSVTVVAAIEVSPCAD